MPKLYLSSCHIQRFLKANIVAQKAIIEMQTETASSKISACFSAAHFEAEFLCSQDVPQVIDI